MRALSGLLQFGVSVLAATLAVATPARAGAPAPITYAAQSGANDLANNLTGGDANSYGYGRNAQQHAGPVLDLRPGVQTTRHSAPIVQAAGVQTGGQGAQPDWLERERVGAPYQANGRWYVPTPEPGYSQTGMASWYGPGFHGQASASGETYDESAMTAAMPTLPIPSLVQVTNLANGREVILRVTDRGPFVGERIIDVSHRAAEVLGFDQSGTARVHVRYLGPAPRHYVEGRDASATPARFAAATPAPAPVAVAAAAPQQPSDGPVSLLPPSSTPGDATPTNDNAPTLAQTQAPNTQTVSWTQRQPQPLTAPVAGFVVQLGAFSSPETAERVRAAAQSAGSVGVEPRSTASGTLYRVRMGPYATREDAEAARAAAANLGFGQAIVTR